MRWKGRRQSSNVEDMRSSSGRSVRGATLGAGGGLLLLGFVIVALCMGADPADIMRVLQDAPVAQQQPLPGQPPGQIPADLDGPGQAVEQDERAEFVAVVLADTEEVWHQQFNKLGKSYDEPKLRLFRGSVESACGYTSAAVGPFYCPLDQKVYIDLSFYDELRDKMGAPGDFAQAYVIAHEVGHHVQNLLGISDQVQSLQRRASKEEANELSVRLELQADFFAGVWAHHAERNWKILEPGDIEEALNAATAIGDDRLQMKARGYVVPESFTHGSSKQRARWFFRGLKTGDMDQGDTFNIDFDQL
jgi:predicted metalloprotease